MFPPHPASTGLACGLVRALVWRGPRRMAVEEIDEPRLGDDAVIVHSEAAGICGSEIEGYLGRMANRVPPLVMWHEFAATVVSAPRGPRAEPAGLRAARGTRGGHRGRGGGRATPRAARGRACGGCARRVR